MKLFASIMLGSVLTSCTTDVVTAADVPFYYISNVIETSGLNKHRIYESIMLDDIQLVNRVYDYAWDNLADYSVLEWSSPYSDFSGSIYTTVMDGNCRQYWQLFSYNGNGSMSRGRSCNRDGTWIVINPDQHLR